MSVEIEIPFRQDMRDAILEGRKVCTSRNSRYGYPGDYFILGGRKYVITLIRRLPLKEVAETFHREEGVEDQTHFIWLWEEIHPRKGFNPDQLVWTHFFQEAS
jgi:hypothetical protein